MTELVTKTRLQLGKGIAIDSDKLFRGHVGIAGASVDRNQPFMYRQNGSTKTAKIGKFVDRFYSGLVKEGPIAVTDIEVPCLNLQSLNVEWQRLQYVLRHSYTGDLLEFRLQTGRAVTVTPNHSVFTCRNGQVVHVPAGELEVGDIVLAPSRISSPVNACEVDVLSILRETCKDELDTFYLHGVPKEAYERLHEWNSWRYRKRDVLLRWRRNGILPLSLSDCLTDAEIRKVRISARRGVELPVRLNIDAEFARFLGYYVAEGHAKGRKRADAKWGYTTCFTLGPKDDIIIHDIEGILHNKLGKPHIRIRSHGKNAHRLEIHDKVLYYVMMQLAGTGAKRKHVPEVILNSPSDVRKHFLRAWTAGDAGVTTSHELSSDIQYLLLLDEIVATFSKREAENQALPDGRVMDRTSIRFDLKFPRPSNVGMETWRDTRVHDEPRFVPLEALPNPLRYVFRRNFVGEHRKSRTRVMPKTLSRLVDWRNRLVDDTRPQGVEESRRDGLYRSAFGKALKIKQGERAVLTELGKQIISEIDAVTRLARGDLAFLLIKEKKTVSVSSEFVYDVSVPEHENFVCGFGGVICHNTGAGKSRNVAAKLLDECIKKKPVAPNGIPYAFIVIDTNDEYIGFTDRYPEQVVVFSPDATRGIPFRIISKNITIDDLSRFLKEVTKQQLSKAELASLYLAIDELRAKGDYTLEQVYTRLYELEEYTLLPALEKIMATNIFAPDETPLKLLARPGQASILAIGGYSEEIQTIIVAHLLRKVFLARKNNEIGPCVVFLEEASVFSPEGELRPSSEILRTIATQARGYSLLLVSIFQRSGMTGKTLISQVGTWFIGKTGNPTDRQAIMRNAENIEAEHDKVIKNLKIAEQFLVTGFVVDSPTLVEIPDQEILLSKGGRVKPTVIEATFRREDMTDYVAKIRSLEETEQKRMSDEIARLRLQREEKLKAPVIPKETQKELTRVKAELTQMQGRYQRALESLKEKEKGADRKARDRYETIIKELEAQVERLTRQIAIAGATSPEEKPVWEQDIVKHRLKALSEKQRDLMIFLERSGPSAAEKIAPTLGVAPKTVTSYVSEINSKIQGLVAFDERKGVYRSRIAELFPTQKTESSKAQEAEIIQARQEAQALRVVLETRTAEVKKLEEQKQELSQELDRVKSTRPDDVGPVLEQVNGKLEVLVRSVGKMEEE